MAVREYFSFRYAIPGYTFILLVVLVNYVPLLKVLREPVSDIFGALLAFVSLFTGSAIGFLVSQIWYLWYQKRGSWYGHVNYEVRKLLDSHRFQAKSENKVKEYKITTECKKKRIEPLLTYMRFQYEEKTKYGKFTRYFQKRMDLYHILSSTIATLILAWISGIVFRLVFWLCFDYPIFTDLFADLQRCSELWVQIIISICVLSLSVVFHFCRCYVMKGYSLMARADLTTLLSKLNEEQFRDLKNAFPECFSHVR